MPCPYPGQKEKDRDLRAQAEHRTSQRDARRQRAVDMHLAGEPHNVIMERLSVTRAGLVKWLKAAGLSGNSVRPTDEAAETLAPGKPVPDTSVRWSEFSGGRVSPHGAHR